MRTLLYAAESGTERKGWLIANVKIEAEAGHKLYYLGSIHQYEFFCRDLKNAGVNAQVVYLTKEETPADGDCVFTENLLYEMWAIWPMAYRKVKQLQTTWYATLDKKDLISD